MAVDLDPILNELGQFGRYQIRNYCFILFAILFSAVYNTQYIFAAGDVNYRCLVPECDADPPEYEPDGWGTWALPDTGGRCERLVAVSNACSPNGFLSNQTISCDSWVYEKDTTIVAEFDLACNEWQRTLVGTIHSAGNFVSLIFISSFSDNFGRKWALIFTAVSPAVVGVIRVFSVSYVMYIVLEFLEAALSGGVYTTCFVLGLEMVGLNKRVLGGNLISCTWALGQVVAALAAWAFPYWKTYTLVIYIPSFLFISYYWLIEESIRWLLSRGNKKEAARILFKVADYNKKKLSPETIKVLTDDKPEKQTNVEDNTIPIGSIMKQVIRSRVILCRLLICSVWWITLTFTYYGLSINSVSLAGNMYVNYILTALVEIPGYFMSYVTLDRYGRKRSIMIAYFVCAAALLALPFSPTSQPWMRTTFNMIGKLSISMAFSSVYIYTGELFPTQVRHISLGACSMVGRIGSIIAPQTPLLMAYMEALPYLIFGSMAAISGLLMILTPETLNTHLPDTIDQAENINQKKKDVAE